MVDQLLRDILQLDLFAQIITQTGANLLRSHAIDGRIAEIAVHDDDLPAVLCERNRQIEGDGCFALAGDGDVLRFRGHAVETEDGEGLIGSVPRTFGV